MKGHLAKDFEWAIVAILVPAESFLCVSVLLHAHTAFHIKLVTGNLFKEVTMNGALLC
jgi:hypothetical protein